MGSRTYTAAQSAAIIEAGVLAARTEIDALGDLPDQLGDSFAESIEIIRSSAGKVFVAGSGTSSAVARRTAHLLSVTGTPAVFLHPMDALHGSLGAVESDDILLAFSKGGGSTELNQLCRAVREVGAPVIAVTETPDSAFASDAEVVVLLSTRPAADPGGMIGMGSTLLAALWADALARVLMRIRGRSWEQVLRTHPAGAVGSRGMRDEPEQQPLVLPEREVDIL